MTNTSRPGEQGYIVWNEVELENFYRFVCERHTIWHRRFVEASPPPWTKDPILRKNKFTNIYRELDPGTRFVVESILEREAPRPDKVFNTMLYRLMCSIPTYTKLGFQYLSEFTEKHFDDVLCDIYNSGAPVFGNAYLISPYASMGSEFKFRNVSRLFGHIHRDFANIWRGLDNAKSFEDAFYVIEDCYGFGPFLAYQVLVDLTYPLDDPQGKVLPFGQNEWARLGPGAMRGINRMARVPGQPAALRALRWLWSHQHEQFMEYGLNFPYLNGDTAISLANMQNCLCEFHKYRSIQSGTGKAQRLYIPTSGG